jgi:hypothetical protein
VEDNTQGWDVGMVPAFFPMPIFYARFFFLQKKKEIYFKIEGV